MTLTAEPLPSFLAEPPRNSTEISVTGKWLPTKAGDRFRKTEESREMSEWEGIHAAARADEGVSSTQPGGTMSEGTVA